MRSQLADMVAVAVFPWPSVTVTWNVAEPSSLKVKVVEALDGLSIVAGTPESLTHA